ncbi:MAG: pyridoxal-phosphate dependent enzyme [Clostridiales bacterium]|nr:pyridoxal-phosphate dependent enzyme [Clostridiales bacterium]
MNDLEMRPPRLALGMFPTPLQEMDNLRELFGGQHRILIKRDDLCGVGFGGNKVRKLEYMLAEALEQGCDCVVTGGGTQSNQTLATAACAARAGLKAHLIVPENLHPGIRRLGEYFGAVFHPVENGQTGVLQKGIRRVAKELEAEGHIPYRIQPGASTVLGVIGYVDAMRELYGQAAGMGVRVDHIVCCGGTGNTYAGVALGTKLYSPGTRATAVSIGRRFVHASTLCKMAAEAGQILGTSCGLSEEDLTVHFSCGKGVGFPTSRGQWSIRQLAAREGILLDPTYTGKAFAGMMELYEQGYFSPGENIVFLHTGGLAALLGSEFC